MSFSRQLVIMVFVVVLCAFSVRSVMTVHEMRGYLTQQLRSHARDAARSLGLSVSLHMAEGDSLFVESIVDSMFDSGDYVTIRVDDLDGNAILVRERSERPPQVPDWFVRHVPIETPTSGAEITSGWQRVGRVIVRSHPGYAYGQLWDTMVLSLQSAFAFLLATLLLFGFAMRYMLRPLKLIERQAHEVAERRFPRIERLPRTREFARVAEAMNFMTGSVEKIIKDQSEQARRLERDAYEDPVTGLRNRAATELDIQQLARHAQQRGVGALMFISVQGLDAINKRGGYEEGDAFMRKVAAKLTDSARAQGVRIGRYAGAVFAVVLEDSTQANVTALADRLLEEIATLGDDTPGMGDVNIGIVFHAGVVSADTLIENCESALRNAEQRDGHVWHLWRASETVSTPELEDEAHWAKRLRNAIEARDVVLEAQPVHSADGEELLHREVLARFREDDGELVPAGRFVPIAAKIGLGASLDIVIVEQVLEVLVTRFQSDERLAVNLSSAAVADIDFRRWLKNRLTREPPDRRRRLCLEVTEHVAATHREALEELIAAVRPLGVMVGVDHCGSGDVSLSALRGLALDYAKIYGAFVHGVHADRERESLVRSLVSIAHGMGLKMIAEFVESAEELDAVRAIGFDAVQGYHVGRPGALD